MATSNLHTLALYRHSVLPAVAGALTIAIPAYLTHGLVVLAAAAAIAVLVHVRRVLRRDRLVEELQEREAGTRRLNTVFEDALEGMATLNATLRLTFVNAAFARTLGMTAEELTGTAAGTLVHEDDNIAFDAAINVVTRYGRSECELRVVRNDGTHATLHAVFVGRGRETYIFTKDISEQKAAEAARRVSEERLELASRATNDVIWEWDVVRHRLWISEALPQRIGVPLSGGDVDGDLWIDVIHPEDRERAVCNAIVAMEGGVQYWTEEYRVRRADGTYAHVFDRAFILRDEHGVAQRMIGAMVDVSARKSSEEAIARLVQQNEMLLGSMAEGIFGIDVHGRTTFVNEAAAELLGWNVAELLGCNIHELVHHSREDGAAYPWTECPAYSVLTGVHASTVTTDVFWRKDGTSVAIEYSCRPMRDPSGAPAGAVVTFRDITERRAVERMKDEFVSVVSHELRTPLTSIRGALGLLAGGRVGELPDKAKRMLDIAVSNTDRLVRLINDILDIERMESGRITLQRNFCDAGDLIDEVVEVMRPMAARAGIELEALPCATQIFADPDRIAQTITNLIANAIKFSDPSTRVTVSAREERGKVVFEVADQGRGIPESKLEAIFERFQQVDASDSREKGGSGLGLAICRSIVRQHGGEIWAESAIGHGSRFRFTIPRAAINGLPQMTDGPASAICDDNPKVRVLLVEDDLDLAGVISASFERLGLETLHAVSGTAAIELAQRTTPDLIVLDLIVPGLDGFGVVDWLKDHDLLRRVPLVVYTAIETTPSQRERLTLGPTEFLTKSRVTPEEFERRVVHLLGTVVHARGEMSDVA
jgi:PAS domain S-box-containing protein